MGKDMTTSIHRGAAAEACAANYLIARGLHILARNFRCRLGEIDLIAQEGDCLVFVEVRARQGSHFGGAGASITPAKQRRLLATAGYYLAGLPHQPHCRFDAVLIEGEHIEWLQSAFDAGL